ncbi:MAG TPA: hypothetical protein PKX78_02955, partial [Candidatus Woesebacteria bacterium]|nr:hypothetical protein [Candidatus Woesebacteria bacterium]
MAAHGKMAMIEMQRRLERAIAISSLKKMYTEIVGKQPMVDQKTDEGNSKAMFADIVEELSRALNGKYKGSLSQLTNINQEERIKAVYLYAENLRQLASIIGIKHNSKVFQKVTKLFDPS